MFPSLALADRPYSRNDSSLGARLPAFLRGPSTSGGLPRSARNRFLGKRLEHAEDPCGLAGVEPASSPSNLTGVDGQVVCQTPHHDEIVDRFVSHNLEYAIESLENFSA